MQRQVRSKMIENTCQCLRIFGYLEEKVVEEQRLPHFEAGQNLADIDDIEYFKKKLYQSLNVPATRLEETMDLTWVVPQRYLEMNLSLISSQTDFKRSLQEFLQTY